MKKLLLLLTLVIGFLFPSGSFGQNLSPADTLLLNLEARTTKAESDLSFWKKLKINGWVQAQYQVADSLAAPSVAGGNFPTYSDNRFIIRRGRIKFTYEQSFAQYVLQIDVIEPTPTNP